MLNTKVSACCGFFLRQGITFTKFSDLWINFFYNVYPEIIVIKISKCLLHYLKVNNIEEDFSPTHLAQAHHVVYP